MKAVFVVISLALTGCASGPPPRIYVLSPPTAPMAELSMVDRRPVVELRTVTLPDYLDTLEILVRDGRNELKSSETGRWAERLSAGITHALTEALARRMPGTLVTHAARSGPSPRELLVDIEAFDSGSDGRCVLAARWSMPGQDRHTVEASGRGTFVTAAAGASDAATVAAMSAAVEQLAERITMTLSPP